MSINPKFIIKTARTLSQDAFDEKKCNLLPQNTVLLSCIGEIGKVGILRVKGTTNQQITALIPTEKISSDYLYYCLINSKKRLKEISNSAVVPILNNNTLQKLEIPLPPLPIQKRIAEILDKADALRRKDQELLKKYDELAQAIFIDMFGDPVKNEKGWEVKMLGEYIDYIGDIGSNGSNENVAKNLLMLDNEDYAIMIRTTNLSNNDFTKNIKYISTDIRVIFVFSRKTHYLKD